MLLNTSMEGFTFIVYKVYEKLNVVILKMYFAFLKPKFLPVQNRISCILGCQHGKFFSFKYITWHFLKLFNKIKISAEYQINAFSFMFEISNIL